MTTDKTYKRHDTLAEVLTIREMATIGDALTALSISRHNWSTAERDFIWETRRLVDAAHTQAATNEYAGDYDYPEQEEDV